MGRAAGLHVAPFEFGFAAASIVFGALPAPTVGCFGVLEAGFTGIVAWLGAPIATAAAAALMIRFASLAATGAFWLLAIGPTAVRFRLQGRAPPMHATRPDGQRVDRGREALAADNAVGWFQGRMMSSSSCK